MDIYINGLREGWALLTSGSLGVWTIVFTSLKISGLATAAALAIGLPFGLLVGLNHFVGRRAALVIFNAGMGLPPVFVGLIVAMALSRRGPLGI